VYPPARFGELILDGPRVVEFSEKPQTSQGRINGGFFVFNREIFDYVSEDKDCIFERLPLEKLAANGELMMFEHNGFWQCMDTVRDMNYLNELWDEKKAPWKRW